MSQRKSSGFDTGSHQAQRKTTARLSQAIATLATAVQASGTCTGPDHWIPTSDNLRSYCTYLSPRVLKLCGTYSSRRKLGPQVKHCRRGQRRRQGRRCARRERFEPLVIEPSEAEDGTAHCEERPLTTDLSNRIPIEVFENVIEHMNQRTLCNSALVCQAWNPRASCILYLTVIINSRAGYDLLVRQLRTSPVSSDGCSPHTK
ncbi:uncharacterized protein B0H18DRAFT_368325 [Fomitopsis serialis]|uniref:uncharacterized protein n=1 Tax=Fomitopsis serialis TaxID=139415 RepID=UPI00200860CD|nr:uncharacterized protein B0H18DRAFT_368325 [Neoantrodia serialis]KAH9925799.1 hypothetical protein B0H18DRAFT_368325 [Neoantrodia serialis]